jgi:phenylalanyl-tRNA synthetase alpha chain
MCGSRISRSGSNSAAAGMVHPNVLKAVNIDPGEVLGLGVRFRIERIAMRKYGIHDIRLFVENDVRFLKQF